jgi:hypothetical protein
VYSVECQPTFRRNISPPSAALLDTCFHAGYLLGLFFDPEDGGDKSYLPNSMANRSLPEMNRLTEATIISKCPKKLSDNKITSSPREIEHKFLDGS